MAGGRKSRRPRAALPKLSNAASCRPTRLTSMCCARSSSRAACPIPIWSSAPAAKSASRISCSGNRPMPNSCFSMCCGRISRRASGRGDRRISAPRAPLWGDGRASSDLAALRMHRNREVVRCAVLSAAHPGARRSAPSYSAAGFRDCWLWRDRASASIEWLRLVDPDALRLSHRRFTGVVASPYFAGRLRLRQRFSFYHAAWRLAAGFLTAHLCSMAASQAAQCFLVRARPSLYGRQLAWR